jgi:hypothetical protein
MMLHKRCRMPDEQGMKFHLMLFSSPLLLLNQT